MKPIDDQEGDLGRLTLHALADVLVQHLIERLAPCRLALASRLHVA
jgi:hypothetical protein